MQRSEVGRIREASSAFFRAYTDGEFPVTPTPATGASSFAYAPYGASSGTTDRIVRVRHEKKYVSLLVNRARIEGIFVFDYADGYGIATFEMAGYSKDGKMKSKEEIVVGVETFAETLLNFSTARTLGNWFCRWLGLSSVWLTLDCASRIAARWPSISLSLWGEAIVKELAHP